MGASQRSLGLAYHTTTAGVLGSSVPTTHLTQGANPRQSPQAPLPSREQNRLGAEQRLTQPVLASTLIWAQHWAGPQEVATL